MAGHSKWAQIKHSKGIADQKRGRLFSKLLAAISAAAKTGPDPRFNPRLRTAVETAKKSNVPNDAIERALLHASKKTEHLEELLFEAYGPGGAAFLLEAATDSRNRTVAEIKKILSENGGKWAEPGSVQWAFQKSGPDDGSGWTTKFPHVVTQEEKEKISALIAALKAHADIRAVHTNAPI